MSSVSLIFFPELRLLTKTRHLHLSAQRDTICLISRCVIWIPGGIYDQPPLELLCFLQLKVVTTNGCYQEQKPYMMRQIWDVSWRSLFCGDITFRKARHFVIFWISYFVWDLSRTRWAYMSTRSTFLFFNLNFASILCLFLCIFS